MEKSQNLNIVQQESNNYKLKMIKKIILLCFLFVLPITACSTLSEINEKAKGDGVPYIPGI